VDARVELQIIGGGRMGEALLGGLIGSGWAAPERLAVVELDPTRRDALVAQYPGLVVSDTPGTAAGTILATKPAQITSVAAQAVAAGGGRLLSIAAGVTLAELDAAVGAGVPVVRAMPNTPSLVGVGAAAISGGAHATEADLEWATTLLGSVGMVVRVPESLMDAVTGLSGSGPAYVFLIAEAMIDAGVLVGLPRDTAAALAAQTLLGAATLLASSDDGPAALRAAVTSPGGTTAAGLRAMEDGRVRAAIIDAVVASSERSAAMSKH